MRDALEMLLLDVHLGTTEGLADDQINHPNLFSVFLPFPVRFLTLRGLSFVTLRHLGRVYLHFYGSQGDEKTVNRRVSLCCTHSESLGQKWKFTLGLIHSHPDPFGAQVEWRLTSVFSASWDNLLVWSLIFALLAWCKTDNRQKRRKRKRAIQTQTQTDTHRQTQTHRHGHTDTQTHRHTHSSCQAQPRVSVSLGAVCSCACLIQAFHLVF